MRYQLYFFVIILYSNFQFFLFVVFKFKFITSSIITDSSSFNCVSSFDAFYFTVVKFFSLNQWNCINEIIIN